MLMVAPTTAAVAPAVAPAEPTKAARVYNFVPEWKQDRPWLRFDALAKAMTCALCISTGDTSIMDSVWCSVGCERMRKGSVEVHEVSAGHKAAVDIVKTRESNAKGMTMPSGLAGAAEAPFLSSFANAFTAATCNQSAKSVVS